MADRIVADAFASPITQAAEPHYVAVVFKRLPPVAELSCSEAIPLPGDHAAPASAWRAVFTALRGDSELIGGEVRPQASA